MLPPLPLAQCQLRNRRGVNQAFLCLSACSPHDQCSHEEPQEGQRRRVEAEACFNKKGSADEKESDGLFPCHSSSPEVGSWHKVHLHHCGCFLNPCLYILGSILSTHNAYWALLSLLPPHSVQISSSSCPAQLSDAHLLLHPSASQVTAYRLNFLVCSCQKISLAGVRLGL